MSYYFHATFRTKKSLKIHFKRKNRDFTWLLFIQVYGEIYSIACKEFDPKVFWGFNTKVKKENA